MTQESMASGNLIATQNSKFAEVVEETQDISEIGGKAANVGNDVRYSEKNESSVIDFIVGTPLENVDDQVSRCYF